MKISRLAAILCFLLLPALAQAEGNTPPVDEGDGTPVEESERADEDPDESDAALRWLSGEQRDTTRALPPAKLGTVEKPRTLKRTSAQGTVPVVNKARVVARAPAAKATPPEERGAEKPKRELKVVSAKAPNPKADAGPRKKAKGGHFVFRWPVKNVRITSRYGMRKDPKKRKRRRMHKGTDFGGRRGTPVLSTAPGTVLFAGRGRNGVGICVVIRHADGWVSRYFHLSKVDVKSGQWVKRGQKVGRIGSTGRSTGPHLHFQVERHGKHRNPEKVIGRRSDKVR